MKIKRVIALVLAVMMLLAITACGSKDKDPAANGGDEKQVLRVGMECTYPPYNWTQSDDSNGAVPIKDSNEFANGYDVMMAKKLAEENGVLTLHLPKSEATRARKITVKAG